MSWCCFLTLQVLAHSERLRGLLCTTVLSKGPETLFYSSGCINASNGLLCIILNVKADIRTVTKIIYTYHKERSMSGWSHLNTRSLTWTKNNSLGIRIGAITKINIIILWSTMTPHPIVGFHFSIPEQCYPLHFAGMHSFLFTLTSVWKAFIFALSYCF